MGYSTMLEEIGMSYFSVEQLTQGSFPKTKAKERLSKSKAYVYPKISLHKKPRE